MNNNRNGFGNSGPSNDEPVFGPVRDNQPDYWQKNNLRIRDGNILDNHFNLRKNGQRNITGVRVYSLPKSQQVALREQIGGIPVFDGSEAIWSQEYMRAQSRIAGNNSFEDQKDYSSPSAVNNNIQDVNVNNVLAQRIMSQQTSNIPQSLNNGNRICQLQEGHIFYNALNIQGFGTTTPVVKTGGQIKGVSGREFQIDGGSNCYVVDGLQTIDLSKMEPQRMKLLIKVSAPLIGTFLVPKEAIIEMNGNNQNNGRQLLIDVNQGRRVNNQSFPQQMQNNIPNQRPSFNQPMQQPQPVQNTRNMLQDQATALLRKRGILRG